MHPLLRLPYAATAYIAELAADIAPAPANDAAKWRRALSARKDLRQRLRAFAAQRSPEKKLAWFHAPSVGEMLMAQPILHRLRSGVPPMHTALTWFSPSAEALGRRLPSEFRDYLGFDSARMADAELDALQPSVLTYSKLDVWPVLTERATARGIPVALIAASLAEASGRRSPFARALLHDAYARLAAVGAASADDAQRLVDLGVSPDVVVVTGDTRYDQAFALAGQVSLDAPPLVGLRSNRPTVVAGSTWPADEAALLAAWRAVRRRIPEARLIVAPHEPTDSHVHALMTSVAESGLRSARLSDEPAAADADVVIVDSIGVLAKLYKLGSVAYVGGGFHQFGLHSVVEPAALAVPSVVGPQSRASRDAETLIAAGGSFRVSDAAGLATTIELLLTDETARRQASTASIGVVHGELGAAERSAGLLFRLVV